MGAVSHYVQRKTFGKTWLWRNAVLGISVVGFLAAPLGLGSIFVLGLWLALSVLALAIAVICRALFYVLVIPSTMPGAFFWKNQSFEEHPRDIGLADMPQVGFVPLGH